METEGSRPVSPPPVKDDGFDDPRCLPPTRCHLVARSSSRVRVLRRRLGCPPLASRTSRLSAFERQTTTKLGFCNQYFRDARARPSSPRFSPAPVLSPGSRFDGLRRPESHVDLRPPTGTCLAARQPPLDALSRFGIALTLAFATSPHHTCQDVTRRGRAPRALRSTSELTTSS